MAGFLPPRGCCLRLLAAGDLLILLCLKDHIAAEPTRGLRDLGCLPSALLGGPLVQTLSSSKPASVWRTNLAADPDAQTHEKPASCIIVTVLGLVGGALGGNTAPAASVLQVR